jgi:hypothetical protein
MKKLFFLAFILFATLSLLQSCASAPEDKVKDISKDGSIETQISVEHLDTLHDILITTHKVWIKNNLHETLISRDTIPFLGTTIVDGDDGNGNIKALWVKKDYELYITVK